MATWLVARGNKRIAFIGKVRYIRNTDAKKRMTARKEEKSEKVYWGQTVLPDGSCSGGSDHDTERNHKLCEPSG